MTILDHKDSAAMRKQFIQTFVDTSSDYYIQNIHELHPFSDGLCYIGYLWDCFNSPLIAVESDCIDFLKDKRNVYVMWDIHSADRIFVPDYWKYPKSSVLLLDRWTTQSGSDLPEDIYLFDDTFTWSIAFTHETGSDGARYCIFQSR